MVAYLIVVIVWLICFYAPPAGFADQSLIFAKIFAVVGMAYGVWAQKQYEGPSTKTDDSYIPNQDNHFAPGALSPGDVNSSLVDPSNDPFIDRL